MNKNEPKAWSLTLPVLIPIFVLNISIFLFDRKNIQFLVIITLLATIINLGVYNWFGNELLDRKLYTKEELLSNPVPPVSLITLTIFVIHFIKSLMSN